MECTVHVDMSEGQKSLAVTQYDTRVAFEAMLLFSL